MTQTVDRKPTFNPGSEPVTVHLQRLGTRKFTSPKNPDSQYYMHNVEIDGVEHVWFCWPRINMAMQQLSVRNRDNIIVKEVANINSDTNRAFKSVQIIDADGDMSDSKDFYEDDDPGTVAGATNGTKERASSDNSGNTNGAKERANGKSNGAGGGDSGNGAKERKSTVTPEMLRRRFIVCMQAGLGAITAPEMVEGYQRAGIDLDKVSDATKLAIVKDIAIHLGIVFDFQKVYDLTPLPVKTADQEPLPRESSEPADEEDGGGESAEVGEQAPPIGRKVTGKKKRREPEPEMEEDDDDLPF